ncbi:GNAT family N-acetyltransferase [Streptomyces sp. SDr-06]|uniref:GNAT family N-acetyltransferase n=1 Tax=Streptomyces sp. SDr-06 TaxID=2267702 RepID=UPI000DEB2DCE|nr:GNAT family N-acetyltransferase [Streptomyces sp. SDr-06]RCH64320.1 GNAT family N-acetyltransferase [Streptomyces sp. SDr-06]
MTSRVTGGGRDERAGASVRRASARDARRLTRLVRTSSAYEGPYAPMIAGYRVGPDYIETHRVHVAVGQDGRILGFYALVLSPPELDLMFVADDAQGRGIGRLLMDHMKREARAAGLAGVRIVSHPPAEGFYLGVGARRVGTVVARPPAVMWDRPELELPTGEGPLVSSGPLGQAPFGADGASSVV